MERCGPASPGLPATRCAGSSPGGGAGAGRALIAGVSGVRRTTAEGREGATPGPAPASLPPGATPALRALEAYHRTTRPAAEVDAWLRTLAAEHAGFAVALSVMPAGARRAEVLHMLVGQALLGPPPQRPTCARGCCACCHYEVEVTADEAELLAERVEAGLAVDEARLAAQAARSRGAPAWAALVAPENRCVFLADDGTCRVYAFRPAACRKLLVVSPAVECGQPGGQPHPITAPLAELAVAAARSLPGAALSSLAAGLRAALARRAGAADRP